MINHVKVGAMSLKYQLRRSIPGRGRQARLFGALPLSFRGFEPFAGLAILHLPYADMSSPLSTLVVESESPVVRARSVEFDLAEIIGTPPGLVASEVRQVPAGQK